MRGEIKRCIFNNKMLFVIIIGAGILLFELFAVEKIYLVDLNVFNESRLNMICDVIALSVFPVVAGMFPGIPYSYSYILEKESGYYRHILIRSKTKKYISTKIICAGVSGAIAMAMPYILLCVPVFVVGTKIKSGNSIELLADTVWENVLINYGENTVIILKGVLFLLFGVLWSEISLLISIIISNKYLAFIMPYIIYELLFFTSNNSFLLALNPRFMLRYDMPDKYPIVLPFLLFVFYTLIVVFLIYKNLSRYIHNE